MASIAPALNFRIGADVKGVQKAIREAEKSFRGAVQSFSSIGNSLSVAISAPLAAFGIMSIKAAGDMENLRLAMEGTMKGAGKSVNEARNELEELRKVALAPGIDFEQAVKGSIRLQSVGFEAERARKVLIELANALALSGGTADQLDGVTRQFAQMSAKGKVMQEDLRIILENMPTLGAVIKKEFGTTTAEGLRDLGVTADQFIDRITKKMQTDLPRAAGGISNALVNAGNAITQALASMGEELNKVFGVTEMLDDFSRWITNLVKGFKELDDGTKRLIVGFGVFALTLGPAFKVMQGGVFIVGRVVVGFLELQKVLAQSLAGQAIPTLIAKWKALDLAMKSTVIGAVIAVVLAATVAFAAMSREMSASAKAAQAIEKTQKAALDSIGKEKAEIEILTGIVKNNTRSKEERRAAMDKLIAISPEYRKALKGEIVDTETLDKVTANLVQTMIRKANAEQAIADIAELDKAMRSVKDTGLSMFEKVGLGADVFLETFQRFGSIGGIIKEGLSGADDAFNPLISAQDKYRMALAATQFKQISALSEQRAALVKYAEEQMKSTAVEEKKKKVIDDTTGALKEQQETIKSFSNLPQLPTLATPGMVNMETPFKKLSDSLHIATADMGSFMTKSEQLGQISEMMRSGMDGVGEALKRLGENFIAQQQVFAGIGLTVAGTLEALADSGAGLGEMAQGVVGALKKIIGALIKTGVAAVVTKALLSTALNPFAAIALGAAAGALAQGLFNSLLNKIKIPALAKGGVLTSPQLVMAGEYAGARNNPEIVTPENKMRDVFGDVMRQFGGAGGGTLTCRVDGDDLLFVLQKAEKRAMRTK